MEGYREENWENTLEAISEPRSGVTPMRSSMGAVAESWRMDWSVRFLCGKNAPLLPQIDPTGRGQDEFLFVSEKQIHSQLLF